MQLKLDMSCHLLNVYTKFQIDISKHVEEKSGKHGRTDGRTDGQTDGQTDGRTLPRHNTSRFSNGRIKMILYDIHVKQPSYSTRKKYPISDFSISRFLLTGHFVWWNMKFVLFIWHWYYTMFYTRYFLLVFSSPVYCWSCFSCVFQDSILRPSPERLEHAYAPLHPKPIPDILFSRGLRIIYPDQTMSMAEQTQAAYSTPCCIF